MLHRAGPRLQPTIVFNLKRSFLRTVFGVKVCVWVSPCGLGLVPVLWGRLGLACFPTFLRFSGEDGAIRGSEPPRKPALVNWSLRAGDIRSSTPWCWLVYEPVVREDTGSLQLSLCLRNTWCWSRGQLTLQPWQSSSDRGKESWCSRVLLNITLYRNHQLCTWCCIIFPLNWEFRRFYAS